MNRGLVVLVALLVLFGTGARLAAAQAPARPNVVFILADDLRWDALGYMGHPFVRTPNIDRIAKEGAVFRNAFVTTPLCSPSRGSFLTGQYVHTHGVKGNGNNNARSHELITFPALMRSGGYETGYFGKWHMGNDDTPRPGFDRWVSFKGQGVYVDPPLNIDGQAQKSPGYITDLLSDHAVEFIKRPHGKPFALYLAHKAIHGPFTPAERHKDLYADQAITRLPNAKDTNQGKPALTRPVGNAPPPGPGTGSGDMLIRNQLRCLTAIDEGVGKILDALAETKQVENTLVVFTSDNGYFWGEHGLGDKRWAYDESIRIPLVMRWPKQIKPGARIDSLVLNIDIAPTFLDAAGVPIPRSAQGRSALPLLVGKTAGWRQEFLAEYFAEPGFPRHPTWQAVRSESWKYIRYPELEGMDELYDLKSDRYEMKNLVGDERSKETLSKLRGDLDRLLKETSPPGE